MVGPYQINIQATVYYQGYSMHYGHYTTSVNLWGNIP